MFRNMSTHITRCAPLAVVMLVAACLPDKGATPPIDPAEAARLNFKRAALYSNAIKYRDSERKARGFSGTASMSARALVGSDGNTEIELSTGSLDPFQDGRGHINSVIMGVHALGNKLVSVERIESPDRGPYLRYTTTGIGAGDRLRFLGHLSGVDWRRNAIVIVEEMVKRRPNLAVLSVTAPNTAPLNADVIITAAIGERNGDVGARGNCVLYVNGIEADRADNIWVDAGDVVSCEFLHNFTTSGVNSMEVRIEGVSPRDDDASDDAASGSIEIQGDRPFAYDLVAKSSSIFDSTMAVTHWWNPDSSQAQVTSRISSVETHAQQASLSAWLPKAIEFPVDRIDLSMMADGAQIHTVSLEAVFADEVVGDALNGSACIARADATTGIAFKLCVTHETVNGVTSSRTILDYGQKAGSVTYRSEDSQTRWSQTRGNYYSFNSPSTKAGPGEGRVVSYGQGMSVDVEVMSRGSRFFAEPVIDLPTKVETVRPDPICVKTKVSTGYTYRCDTKAKWSYSQEGQTSGGN